MCYFKRPDNKNNGESVPTVAAARTATQGQRNSSSLNILTLTSGGRGGRRRRQMRQAAASNAGRHWSHGGTGTTTTTGAGGGGGDSSSGRSGNSNANNDDDEDDEALALQVTSSHSSSSGGSSSVKREDDMDGMQHMGSLETLACRFNGDTRVREVRQCLQSTRAVLIKMTQGPDVSDHDFVEEEERFLAAICVRTMALPVGRGLFTMHTVDPIPTEPVCVPDLNMKVSW